MKKYYYQTRFCRKCAEDRTFKYQFRTPLFYITATIFTLGLYLIFRLLVGMPAGTWACVRCGSRRRCGLMSKSKEAHKQLKKDLKLNKQKEKKR